MSANGFNASVIREQGHQGSLISPGIPASIDVATPPVSTQGVSGM